jgi:hypothetical protein
MFIDRTEEVKAFQNTVVRCRKEGVTFPKILCYTGLIGIGKTYLLEHLCNLAAHEDIPFAIGSRDQSNPIDMMVHWAAGLKSRGLAVEGFEKQHRHYQELRHEIEGQGIPGLPALLAQAAMRTGLTLADLHPASKLLKSSIDQESLIQGAGELANGLSQVLARRRRLEDVDLLLDPIGKLTPVFVDGLSNEFVVLLLDDCEKVSASADLDKWLHRLVKATRNALWVFAGWGGLTGEWAPEIGQPYELRLFDLKYVSEFLQAKGLNSLGPNEVVHVWSVTRGLPYTLEIEVLRMKGGQTLGSRGDPGEAFAQRVKEWIGDMDLYEQIRMCAVARRLDEDILVELLNDEDEAHSLWQWLKSSPLLEPYHPEDVEERGRLHPDFHILVSKTIWHDSPRKFRSLHGRLEHAYHSVIQQEFPGVDPIVLYCDEGYTQWWRYYVEWYYHQLSREPRRNLPQGLEMLTVLLDKGDETAIRRVNDVIQIFRDVSTVRSDAGYLAEWANKAKDAAKNYEAVDKGSAFTGEGLADWTGLKDFWEAIQGENTVGKEGRLRAFEALVIIAEEEEEEAEASDWREKLETLRQFAFTNSTSGEEKDAS